MTTDMMSSLSWCVLSVLSSYLDINGLCALGSTKKTIKGQAAKWLLDRANCCIDHVTRPQNWTFRFREIAGPLDLLANHGGWPFYAATFQCANCEDVHLCGIDDVRGPLFVGGGEIAEECCRRSALWAVKPQHQSQRLFGELMRMMRPVRGLGHE